MSGAYEFPLALHAGEATKPEPSQAARFLDAAKDWFDGRLPESIESTSNILAESDASGNLSSEYIYFGQKRVARVDIASNSIHYYLADHLNSTSIVVNASGAIEEESDYTPFGTEMKLIAGGNRYKFTGKERDGESQLDYFGARYYSNWLGRFLSIDPAGKHLNNPQSLNLYSYVLNNPLGNIDPDGADSASAVYKIGVADVTVWGVNPSGSFDVSSMMSTAYPIAVGEYGKTTGVGIDPIVSGERRSANTPDLGGEGLGGCVFACQYATDGATIGYDLSVSFSHGKNGDGPIDGFTIRPTLNPDLRYYPNRSKDLEITMIPGGVGYPAKFEFHISSSALQQLSDEQLDALYKGTAAKLDRLSLAIARAVILEQNRRAIEEEKKKKKAKKKKQKDCDKASDNSKPSSQCKK